MLKDCSILSAVSCKSFWLLQLYPQQIAQFALILFNEFFDLFKLCSIASSMRSTKSSTCSAFAQLNQQFFDFRLRGNLLKLIFNLSSRSSNFVLLSLVAARLLFCLLDFCSSVSAVDSTFCSAGTSSCFGSSFYQNLAKTKTFFLFCHIFLTFPLKWTKLV
ncbi:Uncharacterised protein [Actinobacillus equuli]|nr:Uncharacterised protein [Actinobacillus equuli]